MVMSTVYDLTSNSRMVQDARLRVRTNAEGKSMIQREMHFNNDTEFEDILNALGGSRGAWSIKRHGSRGRATVMLSGIDCSAVVIDMLSDGRILIRSERMFSRGRKDLGVTHEALFVAYIVYELQGARTTILSRRDPGAAC